MQHADPASAKRAQQQDAKSAGVQPLQERNMQLPGAAAPAKVPQQTGACAHPLASCPRSHLPFRNTWRQSRSCYVVCGPCMLHRRRLLRTTVYSGSVIPVSLLERFWRLDSALMYPHSNARLCRCCWNPFFSSSCSNRCFAQGPTHCERQAHPSRRFPLSNPLWRPQVQVRMSSSSMQQSL